jgi:hypothetical protein
MGLLKGDGSPDDRCLGDPVISTAAVSGQFAPCKRRCGADRHKH